MTLMKIACTLLGTVGLTAGTVLAVAEPAAEPLPKPALKASCSPCKSRAATCPTSKCDPVKGLSNVSACSVQAAAACKTEQVLTDAYPKTACSKGECSEKVSAKADCGKKCKATKPVSKEACPSGKCATEAVSTKVCPKAACDKDKCTEKVSTKAACEKECQGTTPVSTESCPKGKCSTKAVSTDACPKAACGKGNCTEKVSTKAACEKKCQGTTSVSADACEQGACSKSTCDTVAVSTEACGKEKCATEACAKEDCTKSACTKGDCKTEPVSTDACAKEKCATKACAEEACSKDAASPCKAEGKSNCEKNEVTTAEGSACAPCDEKQVIAVPVPGQKRLFKATVIHVDARSAQTSNDECPSKNGECHGHTIYGFDFSGAAPAIRRRVVYYDDCSRCGGAMDASHEVAATGCEAKPACVTNTVPVVHFEASDSADCSDCSKCDDCSKCREGAGDCSPCKCAADSCPPATDREMAAARRELARNSEPAGKAAACSTCGNCCCGSCACGSVTAAADHGERPGFAHVWTMSRGHRLPSAIPHWHWHQFHPGAPAEFAPRHAMPFERPHPDTMVRFTPDDDLPGRVHLGGLLPPHYFPNADSFMPAPPMMSPSMPMSSFGLPVAKTHPPQHSEAGSTATTVEGTWSRTFLACTVTFTCRDGRLHGSYNSSEKTLLECSGTYSVSADDQIFGLIDNIDGPGLPGEFTSWLVDQPFAVRFRVDGNALVVKDLRCADLPQAVQHGEKEFRIADLVRNVVCGRFTPVDATY